MKTLLIAFIGALFAFLFDLYIQYCVVRKKEYSQIMKTIFMYNIYTNYIKNIEINLQNAYMKSKANFVVPQTLQAIFNEKGIKHDWINYQAFLHTFKIPMPKEDSLLFLAINRKRHTNPIYN